MNGCHIHIMLIVRGQMSRHLACARGLESLHMCVYVCSNFCFLFVCFVMYRYDDRLPSFSSRGLASWLGFCDSLLKEIGGIRRDLLSREQTVSRCIGI